METGQLSRQEPGLPTGNPPPQLGALGQAGIKATLCPQEGREGSQGGERWLCWPHKAPFSPGPGCPGQAGRALRLPHPPRAWEPLLLAGWVLAGLAAASRAQSSALRGPNRDLECLEPCPPTRCLCPVPWGAARATSGATWCPHGAQPQPPARPGGAPRTQDLPSTAFTFLREDVTSSYPIWEDFNSKATKLHSQLRTTVLAAVAFLDAFQKVADMATNTRGATRDIGSALTRMCMRHRSIETKLRQFTNALLESLINPLQERIEDWKKSVNQLDKDHAKEYKRARHEIKKKSSDTLKLQKKARKELLGKGDLQPQLDSALQDVNDMYLLLEETEKQAVRRALIEERGRFCTFITFLQPVVNGELTMLGEITHLQGIIDDLVVLTAEPHKLPPASEQVIKDLKGSDYSWSYQTPPSSPGSSSSRKSSMCSAPSSSGSAKGGGAPWPGGAQTYSPSSTCRYRSLAQPATATARLSSISSHDSGFVSQDAAYSKPPSPMPSDITSQDWAKAGPHEQPSTLQRRKDRVDLTSQHGEEVSPAASDLAMVLTRGLSLEHQKSSRDSLQYSSGYSTQTTTPSCSEDTIPSQGPASPSP
ncbi:PREDICTED: MTSS1-like protein [Myotis brandtii]|uniref:MTSS1-like protein n=1 Tax=Myotis brandtii TaxID=109478 RepID=UPI0003BBD609|nr:PREDICTED: MTSS1-like protein [Myotis brandtii]